MLLFSHFYCCFMFSLPEFTILSHRFDGDFKRFNFLNDDLLLTVCLVQPQTRIYYPESTFPRNLLRPAPQLTCTNERSNTPTPVTASGTTGLRIRAEETGIGGNSCRISVQPSLIIPLSQKPKLK